MASGGVELVADVRAELGEGPCWDEEAGELLFVDISPGIVYRHSPETERTTHFFVGQEIGAVIPTSDGRLVIAARDGILMADAGGERVTGFAPIGAGSPRIRMNDAKCDPEGRLWAGTMAFDETPGAGDLYRVGPRGDVSHVLGELTISNGLGWSPDGSTMYFIDSMTYAVAAFDFSPEDGEISCRRTFAAGDPSDGLPDGLTVDAEGGVWVCFFRAGQIRRHDEEGSVTEVIDLPVKQVTSCCFGGPDYTDLFITTATFELGAGDLVDQPLAGGLFRSTPGVAGLPPTRFRIEA